MEFAKILFTCVGDPALITEIRQRLPKFNNDEFLSLYEFSKKFEIEILSTPDNVIKIAFNAKFRFREADQHRWMINDLFSEMRMNVPLVILQNYTVEMTLIYVDYHSKIYGFLKQGYEESCSNHYKINKSRDIVFDKDEKVHPIGKLAEFILILS